MAALTAVTPTIGGVVAAPANVASSDTISRAQLGTRGALLEIINGSGSTDTVGISDAGSTPAGNTLGSAPTATVSAGQSKVFYIRPEQCASNGLVTVTHSQTTSVTYKLFALG